MKRESWASWKKANPEKLKQLKDRWRLAHRDKERAQRHQKADQARRENEKAVVGR